MKFNILSFIFITFLTFFAISCHKHDNSEPNANLKGEVYLEIDARAGSQDLILGNTYKTAMGQDLTVSTFDFYLSNIRLKKSDGTEYIVPQDSAYFLYRENKANTHTIKLTVPEGDYVGATYTIGVDSLRSASDITKRTGVLDPAGEAIDMYWRWNSGYIFLKLEGSSPSAALDSATNTRPIFFHVGGFGGYNKPTINNIRQASINFGATVDVRQAHGSNDAPQVHIYADVLKVVNGVTNVDFSKNSVAHGSDFTLKLSENYTSMFSVDHVHKH